MGNKDINNGVGVIPQTLRYSLVVDPCSILINSPSNQPVNHKGQNNRQSYKSPLDKEVGGLKGVINPPCPL